MKKKEANKSPEWGVKKLLNTMTKEQQSFDV